ncbi:MAG TPA: hypothetical protein VH249_22610 [Xanthobacteraceae bacterium]|nr:hypothetical protein [Xanthobacteraceae bacterium]
MAGTIFREVVRTEDGASFSNGPDESTGDAWLLATEEEPSPYAPKWVREGHANPGKVVALRLTAAPQLSPAPGEPPAASFPRNLDLPDDDAVLRRLMQRHSPDPQPAAVQAAGDPVGLALGMVARLMVAGCAAAAVAMLLIGVIPFPVSLGTVVPSETAAPVPAKPSQPTDVAVSERGPKVADRVADVTVASAAAPAHVATVSVRATPVAAPDQGVLEAGEVERLIKRGEDYLAQGDLAAARLILTRAAEARHARAAYSLAATYDPVVHKQLRVVGLKSDIAQARAWYEKAAEYGSAEASRRLATLADRAR